MLFNAFTVSRTLTSAFVRTNVLAERVSVGLKSTPALSARTKQQSSISFKNLLRNRVKFIPSLKLDETHVKNKSPLFDQIDARISELESQVSAAQEELEILREMQKLYAPETVKSELFCDHANESPSLGICLCSFACACRAGTCKFEVCTNSAVVDKAELNALTPDGSKEKLDEIMAKIAKDFQERVPNANIHKLAPVMNSWSSSLAHRRVC